MDLLSIAIWGVLVFTVVGLIFGIALAAAAHKFHVPTNPVIDEVKDNLPAANCGACGFAGCATYAEKVVEDPEVAASLCTPGGQEVAIDISRLTGKAVGEIKEEVARLRCYGTNAVAKQQAEYIGVHTCAAAALSFGGPKACKYGCLGLGDCQRVCAFDAIDITELGIIAINETNCTGCGLCVAACPKDILTMYPRAYRVQLSCAAKAKGKAVSQTCMVGCVQCQKCIKDCPAKAIDLVNGIVEIDHVSCRAYGPDCKEICVDVCPTYILHRPGQHPITLAEKKALEKGARTGTDS